MVTDQVMSKWIQESLAKAGYEPNVKLRQNQRQAISAYMTGRDVFYVSPTGSGKSLTFEVGPFMFDS